MFNIVELISLGDYRFLSKLRDYLKELYAKYGIIEDEYDSKIIAKYKMYLNHYSEKHEIISGDQIIIQLDAILLDCISENFKDSEKAIDFICKFINEKFNVKDSYSENFIELKKLCEFFYKLSFYPSIDEIVSIIERSEKLSNILKVIYESNKKNIETKSINQLFGCSLLADFIKGYCLINNIDIIEDIVGYNDLSDIEDKDLDYYTMYFNEISRKIVFTKEDEIALAREAKKGDINARNMLIEHNLYLSLSIAKSYYGIGLDNGMSLLDLIQEGNNGLIMAAQKFDVDKHHIFSTYATWWIKDTIEKALSEKSRIIGIPNDLLKISSRINYAYNELSNELDREPTITEIADYLVIPKDTVLLAIRFDQELLSLDAPLSEDSDLSLLDTIIDESNPDISDRFEISERNNAIVAELSKLSDRNSKILKLRYGIYGGDPKTYAEVGKIIGLSPQRIRQVDMVSCYKLRRPFGRKWMIKSRYYY